jgi:hypothetical protein
VTLKEKIAEQESRVKKETVELDRLRAMQVPSNCFRDGETGNLWMSLGEGQAVCCGKDGLHFMFADSGYLAKMDILNPSVFAEAAEPYARELYTRLTGNNIATLPTVWLQKTLASGLIPTDAPEPFRRQLKIVRNLREAWDGPLTQRAFEFADLVVKWLEQNPTMDKPTAVAAAQWAFEETRRTVCP